MALPVAATRNEGRLRPNRPSLQPAFSPGTVDLVLPDLLCCFVAALKIVGKLSRAALLDRLHLPDPARRLQRGLEAMSRTSPILASISTNGRVESSCLRQNLKLRKKTRFSARSHVVTLALAASGMAVRSRGLSVPRAGFNHHASLRSSPDIPASPDHSPDCRSAYAVTFKYLPLGLLAPGQQAQASPPLGRRPTT